MKAKFAFLTLICLGLCNSMFSQVVFTHTLNPESSTIEWGTSDSSTTTWYARESGMSDTLQLSYANDYAFHQFTAIPTGWDYQEDESGGTVTRTYFYAGVNAGNPNELYDLANTFVMDFALLTPDMVLDPTTADMSYAFTAIAFPSGIGQSPVIQTEGYPTPTAITGGVPLLNEGAIIPEPSTYALILGLIGLVPLIWIRFKQGLKRP